MKEAYAILEAGLRTYVESGVRIVLSADSGLFVQFFGIAEHRELQAMVQAGMPAQQAIQAATRTPAQILGLPDRGTLEPGKRADLLVLDADPLDNIANTRKIAAVYLAGKPVDRTALRTAWTAGT
ncbi:amidohydrolase family protein [Streptomyces sp. NBC_01317]|uniref:amidohydrolase family protein n=1 Tax=Streptomyces sp. NBC_01317 TaxID=2903822 RepID=UPI002E12E2CA|nr:amidohydrolase family protein [Streptomyces sp. NBC_01317]